MFKELILNLLTFFKWVLFARLIIDYVRMFARNWRPRGIILAFAELTYSLTDKPLFFIRRFIPPLRIGSVSLDLSFVVLFFGIQLLIGLIN